MTISLPPINTNLYATVPALKARLGITDTDDDASLGALLEGVSRAIDRHCFQSFYLETTDTTRLYTATRAEAVFLDPFVSLTSLATDDELDRTYATTWATADYDLAPANAINYSRPYDWVLVAPGGAYTFPLASLSVRVVARFGWPAVPAAIREAALLWGARLYKRKDAPFGVAGLKRAGDLRIFDKHDPDVFELLAPYVRAQT